MSSVRRSRNRGSAKVLATRFLPSIVDLNFLHLHDFPHEPSPLLEFITPNSLSQQL